MVGPIVSFLRTGGGGDDDVASPDGGSFVLRNCTANGFPPLLVSRIFFDDEEDGSGAVEGRRFFCETANGNVVDALLVRGATSEGMGDAVAVDFEYGDLSLCCC